MELNQQEQKNMAYAYVSQELENFRKYVNALAAYRINNEKVQLTDNFNSLIKAIEYEAKISHL